VEIIKRELPLDSSNSSPNAAARIGGPQGAWQKGAWMDPDMNKYDLEHVTANHPRMTREEWEGVYRAAWAAYYTPAHKLTIMRRAAAAGMGLSRLWTVLFFFSSAFPVEKLHPLQTGMFRLKYRRDRRPGLPVEKVCRSIRSGGGDRRQAFAPRRRLSADILAMKQAKRDQKMKPYTDLALTPGRTMRPTRSNCSPTTTGPQRGGAPAQDRRLTHGEHVEAAP